jgi:DNA-binding response OmpR family regulator
MNARILLVEDDRALGSVLRDNLAFDGYDVEWVRDGTSAVNRHREFRPDLIVLDIMLPGKSGFDLFELFNQGGRTSIIILTARDQRADKLRGLSLGADDYVTKPFDLQELLARVHAVLRRARPTVDQITLGPVRVDFRARAATSGSKLLHLTDREFSILEYLAARHDRVVYRDELLRAVWGYQEIPTTRSVDHAIARIRRKLEADPHNPQFIHTVHGDGYRLDTAFR